MPKKKPPVKKSKSTLPPFVVIKKGAWYVSRKFPTDNFYPNGGRIYIQTVVRCDPETIERAKQLSDQIDSDRKLIQAPVVTGPILVFKDLCARWLSVKKATVGHNTYLYYKTLVAHLQNEKSALAERPLREISTMEVQNFYSDLMERGSSTTMVCKINVVLSMMFEQAIAWELTTKNPAAKGLQLPKRKKRKAVALCRDDIDRLLAVCEEEIDLFMWEFALTTAMRPQEYLALTWSDVDWKRRLITVERALVDQKTEEVKTYSSNRVIEVSERFLDRLRLWKAHQDCALAELRVAAAKKPVLDHMQKKGVNYRRRKIKIQRTQERVERLTTLGLIFPNSTGSYKSIWNINRRDFPALLKLTKFKTKDVTPYSLRHTGISLALAGGADVKSVSARAGHASSSFTLDVYGHVMTGAQEKTARILDKEIYGE